MLQNDRIIQINIEEELKSAYIDYSMSVIVSRALPDVRDGLKPVQRRVLFGMHELGMSYNKPYKKSARIVGEVLGKYHPHGDSSVYEAMVRMAQEWSLRYPLVDGQGNFGSVDGDSPAAMRYTETRLNRIADEMLADLEKETVDFQLNFDDTLKEPTVLPSIVPNLLINGATGIAVGMATNMLPHNLSEVIDGIIAYIANNDITIAELMQHIKAPDFPTGGTIYGLEGIREGFETGRGRIVVRAKAEIENYEGNKQRIIVTEIPYQVNKALLIKRTADLINDKKIEGITDLRDESDRTGMRIVYELRKDANPSVVLNQLYSYTSLQTAFGVNNVCLYKGRPRLLNLKHLITYFVEFRHEVVIRRTQYELKKAEERAHILEGLLIALDNLDAVISLIRASVNPDEAKKGLMENFGLSEIQSKAILEMRLQRLTGLERDKIREEYNELMKTIEYLRSILDNEPLRMEIIKNELLQLKDRYQSPRRTDIIPAEGEIRMEDIIDNEQVVITISNLGYIKRTSLTEYREQSRGGKGARGGTTRQEDFIEHLFIGSTHDYLLVFTEKGRCHWLKVYTIPEGIKTSKGRAIQNILELQENDKVKAYLTVKSLSDTEYIKQHYVIFCTKQGTIKKTSLEQFSRPRNGGITALGINEGDSLLEAKLTTGTSDIMIAIKSGRVIRFNEKKVRSMGRTAAGVIGIELDNNTDAVVGMITIDSSDVTETKILTVSEKGYGKFTNLDAYRITNRGGKGVTTLKITDKTGSLAALKDVEQNNGLMIINKSGIAIRFSLEAMSSKGRATQGVRMINLDSEDVIAGVAVIKMPPEEIENEPENTVSTMLTDKKEDISPTNIETNLTDLIEHIDL